MRSDNAILAGLACLKVAIHVAANAFGAYGYIRDELYYLACSDRMAWGYVDHPPFSVAALWLSRLVAGDALVAVRLLPAVSGAVVVVLAGLITRELGGRRFAQVLAACCTLAAPLTLGIDSVFSMNSFEVCLWTLACYQVVLLTKRDNAWLWLLLGCTLGISLLNKVSTLWFGAGLAVGLAVAPNRRVLLTWKPWAAAGLAGLLFLPHVFWQAANGYPTVEFMRNVAAGKYAAVSPGELLAQQALFMNPLTFPFWFGGLWYALLGKAGRPFRALPVIYLVVFAILAITRNVKAVYLTPLMPMLFALGAAATERMAGHRGWGWMRTAVPAVVLVGGVALAPMVLPVLPVGTYLAYADAIGVAPPQSESNRLGRLPQHYADMFGWEDMVAAVAAAHRRLTPPERAQSVVFCNNYGEAGAIDFFGRRHGLPRAVSGHNNYWLWGPGDAGAVVITIGGSEQALRRAYRAVERAGTIRNPYSMPYENDLPVWICRDRHAPLAADWAQFKIYN